MRVSAPGKWVMTGLTCIMRRCRHAKPLHHAYQDGSGRLSDRSVWPVRHTWPRQSADQAYQSAQWTKSALPLARSVVMTRTLCSGRMGCGLQVVREIPVPELGNGHGDGPIQVVPVVVLSQTFPARPSWIPEIRDFVRRCLAESPLTEEGNREVGETVFRALLDAAGPTGAIQVSFRIFPEHVEVDVLHSNQPPEELVSRNLAVAPRAAAASAGAGQRARHRPGRGGARTPRPARDVRRLDVHRAAPGRADPGGGRPAARGLGQDGRPLGRWRDRAAAARPAPHPGTLRRAAVPLYQSGGSDGPLDAPIAAFRSNAGGARRRGSPADRCRDPVSAGAAGIRLGRARCPGGLAARRIWPPTGERRPLPTPAAAPAPRGPELSWALAAQVHH